MKKIFIIILLTSPPILFSQNVGINATGSIPNSSAGLDLDFTDRGLLVPRIALSATNITSPVITPATSLLVYNTATAGTFPNDVIPGFYYWDGTLWIRMFSGQQNGWATTGNEGTNATNNFLGTIDNQDLVVRTNNSERMRIMNTGNIGIKTAMPQGLVDINGGATDFDALFICASPSISNRGGTIFHQSSTYAWQVVPYATGSSLNAALRFNCVQRTAPGTQLATDVLFLLSNNGNSQVGIGGTPASFSPSSKLFVQGNGNTNATSSLNIVNSSLTSMLFITDNGNVGINTIDPRTKLHVSSGDIYLDTPGTGVIFNTGVGGCYRLYIDIFGVIQTQSIACP